MENKILNSYLYKISKFKKLKKEEELELCRQFKDEGNFDAREKLINHNLLLVVKIAYKFIGFSLEIMDLIEEGNIGLIRAVRNFHYRFDRPLSVYAGYWIRKFIRIAIMEKNRDFPVFVPVNIQIEYYNINEKIRYFRNIHSREPNLQEISEITGFSKKKINFIFEKTNLYNFSLDSPINEEGDREMSEIIGSSQFTSEQLLILRDELNKIMKIILFEVAKFSEKSRNIFYECCGLNKSIVGKSAKKIALNFSYTKIDVQRHAEKSFFVLHRRFTKEGYEIRRDHVRMWIIEKISLCGWFEKTTGAKVIDFNIFK